MLSFDSILRDNFSPQYLYGDLKHFLANISLTLMAIFFYLKFGFYGTTHFISLFFLQYSILPLDDWIDKERPFPLYVIPFLTYSFLYYPLITILALIGDLIVNLRVLTKKESFILEKIEGFGNLLIYVLPLTIPIGIYTTLLFGPLIYILFVDSFHKLGHKETKNRKLTWIFGLLFFTIATVLYSNSSLYLIVSFLIVIPSLIPFKLLEKKKRFYNWLYYQTWQAYVAFIGFSYFAYFIL